MPLSCPYCFGRGYKPKARAGNRPGFLAMPCSACRSTGYIDPAASNYRRALAKSNRPHVAR